MNTSSLEGKKKKPDHTNKNKRHLGMRDYLGGGPI